MKCFNNLTDQQLVHLYMNGDADALATLVVRYKDKIFTSIYLLVKDKYLAEDIFQDVFIRIIDTLKTGRYTDEGKFLPWAMRIAHNLCVDHFRKVKRSPSIKTSDDRDIFEVLNFSEAGVDQRMMAEQSHDKVRKMIDLLPEDQREVIIMRHYADLSFKEISELKRTAVFYESPHRIMKTLESLKLHLQDNRLVAIARELTKIYEEVFRGNASEVYRYYTENQDKVRGEFVVIVGPKK